MERAQKKLAMDMTRKWSDSLSPLTDIQVPDIQLSDTQVPDTQAPGRPGPQTSRSFGHPGPWTSRSLDIQVFRTSRSFGRPGPWTSKSPDVQVFRTSRSRKSNAHTLILDWCAFALDGVKNVTDGPTDKAFLGVGYNFKPNIDQNLLNCLWWPLETNITFNTMMISSSGPPAPKPVISPPQDHQHHHHYYQDQCTKQYHIPPTPSPLLPGPLLWTSVNQHYGQESTKNSVIH